MHVACACAHVYVGVHVKLRKHGHQVGGQKWAEIGRMLLLSCCMVESYMLCAYGEHEHPGGRRNRPCMLACFACLHACLHVVCRGARASSRTMSSALHESSSTATLRSRRRGPYRLSHGCMVAWSDRCMLHVVCCMLHVACCVFVFCVWRMSSSTDTAPARRSGQNL